MRLTFATVFAGAAALLLGNALRAEPLWSIYPGFFSPGFAGIVATDLDGDGVDETVVTGSTGGGFSASGTVFLAVLKRTGNANEPYRISTLRRLGAGETLTGQISELPGATPGSSRIVATASTSMSSRIVQFAGIDLQEVSSVAAPAGFRQTSVADINADGNADVLGCLCSYWGDGPTTILSLSSGIAIWTDTVSSDGRGAGQLDGDAALELVVGAITAGPARGRILDGATRGVEWTYPDGFSGQIVFGNFNGAASDREFAVVERWGVTRVFVSQPIYSPIREIATGEAPAVHVIDTNVDGLDEIIVGQGQWGSLIGYGTTSGVPLFTINNPEHGVSAVAVADLDGLPGLELVHGAGLTSSGDDILRIVSIPGGSVRFMQTDEAGPHSSIVRGDIDGNGSEEVVYSTRSSASGYSGPNLYVVDAATGARLRTRSSVLDPWGAEDGLVIRLANVDTDSQQEMVLGLGYLYDARVTVIDGLTLENQWTVTLGSGFVSDVEVFQGANGPLVAVAWGGRVVLLNAHTGSEIWRSVSFQTNGTQRLAVGNLDVDSNIEIALSVGTRAYVLDPASGLVDRIVDLSDTILGHRVEMNAQGCQHVFSMTTELRRYTCSTGLLHSQRQLPFQSNLVGFVTDSFGTIVVSDGNRIRADDNGTNVGEVSGLGSQLGWGNRISLAPSQAGIEVAIGSDDSVHMLRLVEVLFGDGFE